MIPEVHLWSVLLRRMIEAEHCDTATTRADLKAAIGELERELRMREQEYPKRVTAGRMTPEQATERINHITVTLRVLRDRLEAQTQAELKAHET